MLCPTFSWDNASLAWLHNLFSLFTDIYSFVIRQLCLYPLEGIISSALFRKDFRPGPNAVKRRQMRASLTAVTRLCLQPPVTTTFTPGHCLSLSDSLAESHHFVHTFCTLTRFHWKDGYWLLAAFAPTNSPLCLGRWFTWDAAPPLVTQAPVQTGFTW